TPVTASTRRMRWLLVSAIHRFPAASTATPVGLVRLAAVAGPASPENPPKPFPATVVITPVPASTRRMRRLVVSAIHRFPAASTAPPVGSVRLAAVAGPASPEKPNVPFPATVLTAPVTASTLTTRFSEVAVTYTFPAASRATPEGPPSGALSAGWPSGYPPPATVVMICARAPNGQNARSAIAARRGQRLCRTMKTPTCGSCFGSLAVSGLRASLFIIRRETTPSAERQ